MTEQVLPDSEEVTHDVHIGNETLRVVETMTLRDALLKAGLTPHDPKRPWLNCRGFGSCGTCALHIRGEVFPPAPIGIERWRLGFPPHEHERGLRLACQVRPRSDLVVERGNGLWGTEMQTAEP